MNRATIQKIYYKIPLPKKILKQNILVIRKIKSEANNFISQIEKLTSKPSTKEYTNHVLNNQFDKSEFVSIIDTDYQARSNKSKKVIAYYLPQYYHIPQNDAWFGKGFTEWSNVTKAVPQFNGHWQPHLPIDVGFYNLETNHTMKRQVELAKLYGIHGFSFYYYWFSGGDKIMEKPIINWLNDKSLDLPFMLFWANEDWTNTWGEAGDLGTKTYSAKMNAEDIKKFANDILPFLKDDRYIKVGDRPHIIIYQAKKDPYLKEFLEGLKTEITKEGIAKPFISFVFPDDFSDDFNPKDYGGDAAVEFGAHLKNMPKIINPSLTNKKLMDTKARLTEYDMISYVEDDYLNYKVDYPVFKGAMTHFDNTARKIRTGAELFPIDPSLYKKWLKKSIESSETDYVYVSAWNEWAEGMHLEPDHKYGYAYLQATREALEETEQ